MKPCALIVVSALFGCSVPHEEAPVETSEFPEAQDGADAVQSEPTEETTAGAEAVDGIGVAVVAVPGFEELPLEQKRLAYHFYLAALALDAMYYTRLGREQLLIKKLIEGVLKAGAKVPEPIRRKIEPWAKLFWINRGNQSQSDGRKIIPRFIPGELAAAAQAAAELGIDLGTADLKGIRLDANSLERLEAMLAAARPTLFDRSARPKEPDAGPSDGNSKDMEADLKTVARHLRNATPLLAAHEQSALKKLADLLDAPDAPSYDEAMRFQSQSGSKVRAAIQLDLTGGFSAQALESIEAAVFVRDEDTEKLMRRAATSAPYFEEQLPVANEYKRPAPNATASGMDAFNVVLAVGRGANIFEFSPSPDAASRIAAKLGLQNAYAPNVAKALNRAVESALVKEFSRTDKKTAGRMSWLDKGTDAFFILREIVGRPAGRADAKLKGKPEKYLKEHYDFIENMRLDLVALFLAFDPKSAELGLVPNEECAKAIFDDYAGSLLEWAPFLKGAGMEEGERIRAARAVALFAVDRGAVRIEQVDNKFYSEVTDYSAMRSALGELLALVQKIKSTGDYEGARSLSADLLAKFSDDWARDAIARVESLKLPNAVTLLFPLLEPTLEKDGSVMDIKVRIPDNLARRQLLLSEKIPDLI